MGINYDTKLIYGWTFVYDDIFPWIKQLLIEEGKIDKKSVCLSEENYDGDYEIWEIFGQWLKETDLNLYSGYASSYYDSEFNEAIFFISFVDADETDILRLLLNEHADNNNNAKHLELLERLHCDESPEVMALVHIW